MPRCAISTLRPTSPSTRALKGGSQALIDAFTLSGTTLGVPLLQCYGMTVSEFAAARGVEPFPHTLRWLR